ncbi:ANL_HP_G0066650.mRNA.1.CDS.1 [Saccharomyces cerevisiae]|nr:ANL_HP_G0066650.mRNA.1.CDS.1 [Saccharomyces cerevisiae]CAI6931094.1 ANL_HP_G0066650.mRNA.1.CDS.1 [Saccharomyces cerevisiae]
MVGLGFGKWSAESSERKVSGKLLLKWISLLETSEPVRRKQPAEMSTHDRRRKLDSAIPRFVYRDTL